MNVIIAMASEMKSTTMTNNSLEFIASAKEFSNEHNGIYLRDANSEGRIFFVCGDQKSGYVSKAAEGKSLKDLSVYKTTFEDGNSLLVLGVNQTDLSKLKKLE